MKLIFNTFIIATTLLTSSLAFSWRETNNGAGLTEQNIVYVKQNFSNLAQGLSNESSGLTEFEKIELLHLTQFVDQTLILRFENADSVDQKAFVFRNNEWWIQMRHLQVYDKDLNEELSWAEVIQLYSDIFRTAGLSSLGPQQYELFQGKLINYFGSKISQQFVYLTSKHLMQVTSVSGEDKAQSDFLIQLDESSPISLTSLVPKFSTCSIASEKPRFHSVNFKSYNFDDQPLTVLVGLKLSYHCHSVDYQDDLILQLQMKDKQLQLIDWGRQ